MQLRGEYVQQESVVEGIVLVDRRGIITFIDQAIAQALKIHPDNARGRRLTEVFPETRLLEVLTSRQVITQDILIWKQKIILQYCPICRAEDLVGVAVYWHASQLSERRKDQKADAQITSLLSLYEGILEDLPIGIAVADRQGRIVMVNREYQETLGILQQNVRGLSLSKVMPFSKIQEVLSDGQSVLKTEVNYKGSTFLVSEAPIYSDQELVGGLSKILNRERLEKYQVKEVFERFQILESKLLFYKEELHELRRMSSPLEEIIGDTPEMKKIKQVAARVALHDANVLITGESGTGKGILAQAIHSLSDRNNEPFIKINCAAIPENLLESELFGYEEGAFTGAVKGGKPGKFELAQGGTIFLDEIGDMPIAMQAKILRVLQEKSFERVGGHKTLNVNVRLIAATHRDLRKEIDEGKFRLDLYYRLAVINLHIPPLRERQGDISKLAECIVCKLSRKYAQAVKGISPEVKKLLQAYAWPGNVRELENVLEYAFNFLEPEEDYIRLEHLSGDFVKKLAPVACISTPNSYAELSVTSREADSSGPEALSVSLERAVAQTEIKAILQALGMSHGNKQEAARILGIHVSGLYQKLKKYALAGY